MRGFTDETAPHQITLEAYDVRLRVCTSTAELMTSIEPYLPPGWRSVDDPRAHRMGIVRESDGRFTVYDDERAINTEGNLLLSLVVLDSRMRMHIATHSPNLTFIHAGVVAHRDRAIMIPGYSFAGKTTLVAELVRRGAAYYSDEFAVLDSGGLVHPYTKPLSLRRSEDLMQVDRAVDQLGGTPGREPVRLGVAVFTRFVEGAAWHPRRLPPGQAALAMIENAVPARIRPEATMTAVTQALKCAVALRGERGEAAEIAPALLRLAER